MSSRAPHRIDVIATTISGSVSDWQKVGGIEDAFRKHYSGDIFVHVVASHAAAREKAAELVSGGSRVVVSAGGAGTFNSVLEGCCTGEKIPEDLKLAFLRKGSADLIGKALGIPDDLYLAAEAILDGLARENYVTADVIEVTGEETQTRHLLGFGGVGVFGDTPRYTENRFIKYYKGFLGTLFGDLGPFLVGVNLALLRYHIDGLRAHVSRYRLLGDRLELPMDRYVSIMILNGDLGKDFPLAAGMPFGEGDFKIIAIRDMGMVTSYRQLIGCWKGNIFENADQFGIESARVSVLDIVPERTERYMVNVDGLILWARGPIRFSPSGRVKLVSGLRSPY